jgi:hypothetical protein
MSRALAHTPIPLPFPIVAGVSTLAASASAFALAGIIAAAHADPVRSAAPAGVVAALAAILASLPPALGWSRPGSLGWAVLGGSILRLGSILALGLAAQSIFRPDPVSFWAGLCLSWLVGKGIEVRAVWSRALTPAAGGAR